MDQEKDRCYHVEVLDPSAVDLTKPAATVDEYLKQVVVNRMNCTEVKRAILDPSKLKAPAFSSQPTTVINTNCPYAPDIKWQEAFIERFTQHRKEVNRLQMKVKPLKLKLPNSADMMQWTKICLRERLGEVPIESNHESIYSAHEGGRNIERTLQTFVDFGYSRAVFEWFYALLLVVKQPLPHDMISTLRSFVKDCRLQRVALGESDNILIREYTIFIAIISIYFSQRDLKD